MRASSYTSSFLTSYSKWLGQCHLKYANAQRSMSSASSWITLPISFFRRCNWIKYIFHPIVMFLLSHNNMIPVAIFLIRHAILRFAKRLFWQLQRVHGVCVCTHTLDVIHNGRLLYYIYFSDLYWWIMTLSLSLKVKLLYSQTMGTKSFFQIKIKKLLFLRSELFVVRIFIFSIAPFFDPQFWFIDDSHPKEILQGSMEEKCRSMSTVIAYKANGRLGSTNNKPGHENRALWQNYITHITI